MWNIAEWKALLCFLSDTEARDAEFTKLTTSIWKPDYVINLSEGLYLGTPIGPVQPQCSVSRAENRSKKIQQGTGTTICMQEKYKPLWPTNPNENK